MSWFSKKVVVNLYTHKAQVYEYAKPYKAATKKPEWWKNLPMPKDSSPDTNMKACAGFNDLYSKGFVLPLWSDVVLGYGGKGDDSWEYRFADQESDAEIHGEEQRKGWANSAEYQHFKLPNPWIATCDEEVDFLYTNMAYDNPDPLSWFVTNGVLNFKHQGSLQINMMVKRQEEKQELFLAFGTPMAMLVPLTDRKVEFKYHLVSANEWDNIRRKQDKNVIFQRRYYKMKKCPFH